MPRSGQPGRSVSSRPFEVLVAFRPGHSRLTLADLTRETGLPHATVCRPALELVEAGALERAPEGGFTVGMGEEHLAHAGDGSRRAKGEQQQRGCERQPSGDRGSSARGRRREARRDTCWAARDERERSRVGRRR